MARTAGHERPPYVHNILLYSQSGHLNNMYYGHPVTHPNTVFHTEQNFVIWPALYKRLQECPWTFDFALYGHLDYKY